MNSAKIPLSSHVSAETIRRNPHLYCAEDRMRAGLGPPPAEDGPSPLVSPTKGERTAERKIHDEFERWLSLHRDGLSWNHSRVDRKTSDRVGWPDFTVIVKGRVCLIECKATGGRPSVAQKEVHSWLNATGTPVWICYSSQEAIETVKRELGINL